MESLNEREKHILTERRLTDDPQTLEELSQVYDVSRERIRSYIATSAVRSRSDAGSARRKSTKNSRLPDAPGSRLGIAATQCQSCSSAALITPEIAWM